MNRAGIILDTDKPLDASERRARWYALAASLGLLVLGPRQVPRPAVESPALPCEAAGGGVVVRMRRKARG